MVKTRNYTTSFTPLEKKEMGKDCAGNCKRFLHAAKFGMKHTSRGGVKGIARNASCLDCQKEVTVAKECEKYNSLRLKVTQMEGKYEEMGQRLDGFASENETLTAIIRGFNAEAKRLSALFESLPDSIKNPTDKNKNAN